MRSRENEEGLVHIDEEAPFALGDKVKIERSGAWEGLSAVFDGMSSNDRIFVLLNILGAQRRAEIPLEDVRGE